MILFYAITALHVIVCVILVLVVLLQSGKGADLAGAFGGGATQTAFGSRGPASFLSKLTTAAAVVFMLTSITLTMISTKREAASKSILETTTQESAQPAKAAPGAAPIAVPSREQLRREQEAAEAKHRQQASQPATPEAKPATKPAEPKSPSK